MDCFGVIAPYNGNAALRAALAAKALAADFSHATNPALPTQLFILYPVLRAIHLLYLRYLRNNATLLLSGCSEALISVIVGCVSVVCTPHLLGFFPLIIRLTPKICLTCCYTEVFSLTQLVTYILIT